MVRWLQKLLVPDASAMQTAGKSFYKVEGAGHFEVCRPLSEEDQMYREFIEYLGVAAGPLKHSSASTNTNELEMLQ